MNTYSIVNYMKTRNNFAGLCVLAAAIVNAIKTAKRDPDIIPEEMNENQIIDEFGHYMRRIDAMREMWNSLNSSDNQWNWTDYNKFCDTMWRIEKKYAKKFRKKKQGRG